MTNQEIEDEKKRLEKRNTDADFLALMHTADEMYKRGSFARAIEIYNVLFTYLDESFAWDTCELYRKIGDSYFAMKDMDNARKNLEKTLNYSKTNASIYMRLAGIYYSYDNTRGIELGDKAFALDNNFSSYSNRAFCLIKSDKYPQKMVKEKLEEYAADFGPRFAANGKIYTHEKPKNAKKKLRIAYISSDLYNHAMMSFILPLLEHHDLEKYEIIIYCTMDHAYDGITTRVMKACNRFVDCSHLNNFDFAQRIYDDEVDILVDLGGFTHNRSFVFLFKPAPIQVQYLGFLNSLGMKEVDYILADEFAIPKEYANLYTEKPLYVKSGMERFDFTLRDLKLPDISLLPYEENGYITFGSYNDLSKVTTATIRLWAKLLLEVPSSKLLIYRYGPQMTPDKITQIKTKFSDFGVEEERLIFDKEPMDVHFKAYLKSDIALDPTPFGGLTITIEALHMGLPTLTMPAEGIQSRGTGRINKMLGLEEDLNAADEDDFAIKGAALANDVDRLRQFRQILRHRVKDSPLKTDLDGFARDVEAAYETAWQNYIDN